MKKYFTKLSNSAYLKFGRLLLLAPLLFFWNVSSAQYCVPIHYYGCAYTGGSYYAAIEEVMFEDQNGNQLYRKSSDGCNDATNATTYGT